ncbi:hypothetical protein AMTRI_Chr09g39650 [Amborella trichopoda]
MASIWVSMSLISMAAVTQMAAAQSTSCLNQLLPCLSYLNSTTTPPSTCCEPLKSIINSDPQCLCSMLKSGMSGIDMTQAAQLPSKCGVNVNAATCDVASSSPSSSPSPNTPTSRTTPTSTTTVPSSTNDSSSSNLIPVHALAVIIQIIGIVYILF